MRVRTSLRLANGRRGFLSFSIGTYVIKEVYQIQGAVEKYKTARKPLKINNFQTATTASFLWADRWGFCVPPPLRDRWIPTPSRPVENRSDWRGF